MVQSACFVVRCAVFVHFHLFHISHHLVQLFFILLNWSSGGGYRSEEQRERKWQQNERNQAGLDQTGVVTCFCVSTGVMVAEMAAAWDHEAWVCCSSHISALRALGEVTLSLVLCRLWKRVHGVAASCWGVEDKPPNGKWRVVTLLTFRCATCQKCLGVRQFWNRASTLSKIKAGVHYMILLWFL